jgi:hypothetical protein
MTGRCYRAIGRKVSPTLIDKFESAAKNLLLGADNGRLPTTDATYDDPTGPREKPHSTGRNASNAKGKKINEQMAKLLTSQPDCVSWSAEKFAHKLRCSKSTVATAPTWKTILDVRALAEVRRTEQQAEFEPLDKRRIIRKRPND